MEAGYSLIFPASYNEDIDPLRISGDLERAQALAPGLNEMIHLYGEGDHGGGPDPCHARSRATLV